MLRLTATHRDKVALELLAREVAPAGTSWAPGTTGGGGRASASPSIRQYAFLLDKSRLQPRVLIDGRTLNVRVPAVTAQGVEAPRASAAPSDVAESGMAGVVSSKAAVIIAADRRLGFDITFSTRLGSWDFFLR